ncbi:MAG TPA: MogA/MoaB family molybdenum cofactor biosynthesis protein [Micropruina sp.]|nr:MogA/MoaB family molybdenum cofactor biosynthesis protein [Micropruina sp.]
MAERTRTTDVAAAAEAALRSAAGLRATVIVVSDEVASGADTDRGGPVAVDLLAAHGVPADRCMVPDDPGRLRAAIGAAIDSGARVVLACGGTGIGPRDWTSDVVRALIDVEIPGIGEEIRRRGSAHTRLALVSREVAGVVLRDEAPSVLLLAAPGSRGGIRDTLGVVGDLIGYILEQLDGAGHV